MDDHAPAAMLVENEPFRHAFARSPYRAMILLALVDDGPSSVSRIAAKIGVRPSRVGGMLSGDRAHKQIDSLVALRLVEAVRMPRGWRYRATPLGSAIATELRLVTLPRQVQKAAT